MTADKLQPEQLLEAFLPTMEQRIYPLTCKAMEAGNRVFGAAIFDSKTLTPLTCATNKACTSPLLHGEINCIQQFFTETYPDPAARPDPRSSCIFFATHEPCSLCLSGITWAGFKELYFLFTYADSRDEFSMPIDIDILQEVFKVPAQGESEEERQARPLYNRDNDFFKARSCAELASQIADGVVRSKWEGEIERIKGLYKELGEKYKDAEVPDEIPL